MSSLADMKKVYDDLIIINLYLGYILDLDFIEDLWVLDLGDYDDLENHFFQNS